MNIPFHRPSITAAERAAVETVLREGPLTKGPRVERLESCVAARLGVKYAVAACSGSAALHLALLGAGIGSGHEVLVPTLTFAATALAVTHVGARVVLVDVDESLTMSVEDASARIGPRTRALMAVSFAGLPVDPRLYELARQHRLVVIEDAAHSFGARLNGQFVGKLANITCFSFYATKPVASGEGGMLVTDDTTTARLARMLRWHGIEGGELIAPGWKYNLAEMPAALALAQLERCDEMLRRRKSIAATYRAHLARYFWVQPERPNAMSADHLFVICPWSGSRDSLADCLAERGVETSRHYTPLHRSPLYRDERKFSQADWYADRCVSLPIWPDMTDTEVEYVIASLMGWLAGSSPRSQGSPS